MDYQLIIKNFDSEDAKKLYDHAIAHEKKNVKINQVKLIEWMEQNNWRVSWYDIDKIQFYGSWY